MSKRNSLTLVLILLLIVALSVITFAGIPGFMRPLVQRMNLGLDIEGGVAVVYEGERAEGVTGEQFDRLMNDTLSVLSRRINSFGLTEPNITRQGTSRIRIELPGAQDVNSAVDLIGKTAVLEFYRMESDSFAMEGMTVNDPLFKGEMLFKGDMLRSANAANQEGRNIVSFELSDEATAIFSEATRTIVDTYPDAIGQISIALDDEVISAPTVNQVLNQNNLLIEGNFTANEAILLANLIQGGSLPMELEEVQTTLINATLGQTALDQSILAGLIGFALIGVFMILRYRLAGVIAILSLVVYGALTLLALIAFGATLTLPGIAGLILSVGMAVDANIIIFERLREELGAGKTLRTAIKGSYHRAMSSIVDSNVTTLVAGVILYYFGEGPIKGFAITLSLGIILSMFTALVLTRIMLNQVGGIKSLSKVSFFGRKDPNKASFSFDWMKYAKYFTLLSVILLVVGLGFFFVSGFELGIDFTGGTLLDVDLGQQVPVTEVTEAISSHNLNPTVIHSGDNPNVVTIKTNLALDNAARNEVFSTLRERYGLQETAFLGGEQFGPAVGQEISNRAIVSIALATIAILAYVTLRFKFLYGVSAIVALVHDTLMLLVIYLVFRVTVNSSFIAAILTVVGYSINDTIVLFDKLRDNVRIHNTTPRNQMNISINETLTRTIFTSLTTFMVVFLLYILGVDSVREFAFPLLWGIIIGTYSTIFIASYTWVRLKERGK